MATSQLKPSEHPRRMIPALDGIRGIAILLVMAVHTGGPFTGGGTLGVDMFFALSGFLITTLLLEELVAKGTVNLKKFYARRFLRLMPLYVLYISGLTILETSGFYNIESHGGWDWRWHIASLWLYFVNYLPLGGFSYWNSISYHLWSLSVEEQFYLLWPFILILFSRTCVLVPVAWILVLGILLRVLSSDDVAHLQLHTDKRGFGIFLGAAAAITCFRWRAWWTRFSSSKNDKLLVVASIAGILCLAFPAYGIRYNQKTVFSFFSLAFAASSTLAIATIWYGGAAWLNGFLTFEPLVFTGKISYGMYVWNPLVHFVTWNVITPSWESIGQVPKFGGRVLIYVALNYVVAWLSYRFYEARFLRLKEQFR